MPAKKAKPSDFMPKSKATNAHELLDEIRNLILEEPRRYNQEDWLKKKLDAHDTSYNFPACNTIGCVAGWTVALKRSERTQRRMLQEEEVTFGHPFQETAQRILGLTDDQVSYLFNGSAVQDRLVKTSGNFIERRVVRPGTKMYARLGYNHITRFMKKHEAQLKAKRV